MSSNSFKTTTISKYGSSWYDYDSNWNYVYSVCITSYTLNSTSFKPSDFVFSINNSLRYVVLYGVINYNGAYALDLFRSADEWSAKVLYS